VFEPVVTVALAALVFGESLSAIQLAGGLLVLVAIVVVQWPARRSRRPSRPPLTELVSRNSCMS
jgi:drug/metabolite transporter (DMT)-like permease